MAMIEDTHRTPVMQTSKLSPRIAADAHTLSRMNSTQPKDEPSPPKKAISPKDAILAVSASVAAQPLPCSDPEVWGVLTAISNKARKRSQGINILLTADEHVIGRLVEDGRFQIDSSAVSQRHCTISRKKVFAEDIESPSGFCNSTFLKDTSTNGTYFNWERLKRGSSKFESKLCHGDIVSFAAPPQHEQAFAFVYREVHSSVPSSDTIVLKRKAEEFGLENKRLKGIGIGAPEGPVSLDDFRSLQRSNAELRTQLENQVVIIEKLQNDNRGALERHENEMKELGESISKSYLDQVNNKNELLENTKKELNEVSKASAEQKHAIEDLKERLASAQQSYTEVNEIMKSQKASIAELKVQLDEERELRKDEREKAAADLKASVQRVQSEAQGELQRVSDVALTRERELLEVINKLQDSDKENSSLVETLRNKLEETRQKLVLTDNRIRQLEALVLEEQQASALKRKRVEELELGIRSMNRELEKQKADREEAWAKVSALELEINAAVRDLEFERRRLKGARERIMLRETQLRSFYSTTEEIKELFTKQQEQLKAMQRTLEDEEHYGDASFDMSIDAVAGDMAGEFVATCYQSITRAKAGLSTSAQMSAQGEAETSCDEGSETEKHECDIRSQDDVNTQEAEFPVDDTLVDGGFGSDIDLAGTTSIIDGDADGTKRVLEMESPGVDGERNTELNKSGTAAGDTMRLEDDSNVHETEEQVPQRSDRDLNRSQMSDKEEAEKVNDDTEPELVRTEDLLASEVAGSWACDTAPSVYGDNGSPHNDDREAHAILHDSVNQVAESQNSALSTRFQSDVERQAPSDMIGIMAPDVKEQFGSAIGNSPPEKSRNVSDSDSDTDDECVEASKDIAGAGGASGSDDETQVADEGDHKKEDNDVMDSDNDEMDEDDDYTQEDSLG